MNEKRGAGIGNTTNGTCTLSSVMQIVRLLIAQKSTVACSVILFYNRAVSYFALSSPPGLWLRFPSNVAMHMCIVYWRLYGYIYALFKHNDILISSLVMIIATKWNNIFWFLICCPCLNDKFTNIAFIYFFQFHALWNKLLNDSVISLPFLYWFCNRCSERDVSYILVSISGSIQKMHDLWYYNK
jgi:hypothetical protein